MIPPIKLLGRPGGGRRREARPDVAVGRGEKVLAWTTTQDGVVLVGTRDAAYLDGVRVPWEEVEAADWDRDSGTFRLSEVAGWGSARAEHTFVIEEPGRFLELVRERVTASVILQRHVPVRGSVGVRVIARRAPRGGDLAWFVDYDEGLDPDAPDVRRHADAALEAARGEVGEA